jgi:hypothetical protein
MARTNEQVIGLVNGLAPVDDWDLSGAVVNAATAAGVDPLQGVPGGANRKLLAFRAGHMGMLGEVTGDPDAVDELRSAYTPPVDLVAESAAIIERYYRAERVENLGAIPYEFTYLQETPVRGLVDAATAKIFNSVVNRGAELGLLTEEQEEIRRSYVERWRWNDSGEEVDFTRWEWIPGADGLIQMRDEPESRARRGEGPGEFSPVGGD